MGALHISNRSEQPSRRWSRRGLLTVLGIAPAAAVLSGCSGSADASEGSADASEEAARTTASPRAAKEPVVSVSPADGTGKAAFTEPVEVTVTGGTLASVKVVP